MNILIQNVFLASFARNLKRQCTWAPGRRELSAHIAGLGGKTHMAGGDRQAEFNLLLAKSLRAAVRILQGRGYGRARAVEMARAAFLDTGSGWLGLMIGGWLRLTKDPVSRMKKDGYLLDIAGKFGGAGLQAYGVEDDTSIALHVTDCPFARFFWNASEPDLLPILCAYEAKWMAQVNRSGRPVRVSRAGTLATGAEHCDFTFRRVADRSRHPARAVTGSDTGHAV